jgi:hypothetical protein
MTITASNPRPSTATPRGTDLDVTLTVGGITTHGEVTFVPSRYDGRPEPLGPSADYWMSADLLDALRPVADGFATLHEVCAAAVPCHRDGSIRAEYLSTPERPE